MESCLLPGVEHRGNGVQQRVADSLVSASHRDSHHGHARFGLDAHQTGHDDIGSRCVLCRRVECAGRHQILRILLHAAHDEQVTQTLQLLSDLRGVEDGAIDRLARAHQLVAVLGPRAHECGAVQTGGHNERGQEQGEGQGQGV